MDSESPAVDCRRAKAPATVGPLRDAISFSTFWLLRNRTCVLWSISPKNDHASKRAIERSFFKASLRLCVGAPDHHDRLGRLINWRPPQWILRKIHKDRTCLLGVEMQRPPVNDDLAGTDP